MDSRESAELHNFVTIIVLEFPAPPGAPIGRMVVILGPSRLFAASCHFEGTVCRVSNEKDHGSVNSIISTLQLTVVDYNVVVRLHF